MDEKRQILTSAERISVYYHNIFDYPLNLADLIRWKVGPIATLPKREISVQQQNGFYYLSGRAGLITKRKMAERVAKRKEKIAQKAATILKIIPTIEMIGITGALAMNNTKSDSDIDLIIVVKKGFLWTSRLISYLLLNLTGVALRKPGSLKVNDRLCLNIWLDKSDLVWPAKDRNIYTAHEIAQVRTLLNRGKTHEELLGKNSWILNYWPKAVKTPAFKLKRNITKPVNLFWWGLEKILFWIQYSYMKPKITHEVVTSTRAIFHPFNWGKMVLQKFT